MGLFNKGQAQPQVSDRQKLINRFASGRGVLLSIVLFTALNIVLLVTNSNTYFLFSAFIPYALVDYGMYFCGKYPAEFYEGDLSEYQFWGDSVLIVLVVIAVVILVLYLLCWLFSKKPRVGWLIAGLVFFAMDTVLMLLLGGEAFMTALDLLFHGWALFSLIFGIISYYKLKKLPAEEEIPVPVQAETSVPVEENI